jgi:hypothetical protein
MVPMGVLGNGESVLLRHVARKFGFGDLFPIANKSLARVAQETKLTDGETSSNEVNDFRNWISNQPILNPYAH